MCSQRVISYEAVAVQYTDGACATALSHCLLTCPASAYIFERRQTRPDQVFPHSVPQTDGWKNGRTDGSPPVRLVAAAEAVVSAGARRPRKMMRIRYRTARSPATRRRDRLVCRQSARSLAGSMFDRLTRPPACDLLWRNADHVFGRIVIVIIREFILRLLQNDRRCILEVNKTLTRNVGQCPT